MTMHTSRIRSAAILAAGACAAGLALAAPANAAAGLQTFGDGAVTIAGDDITIVNDAGEHGGVYLKSRSTSGKKLAAVDFGFTNTGSVAGGAPRFSLPIDTDADGDVDGYAFLDVNGCDGDADVSTDNAGCKVYFHTEPAAYDNWDAFAAAHPTWRMAPGAIPFVIADVGGSYSVTDIVLR
jgi:hypothetical protein